MLKKLRRKFIILIMSILAVVLTAVIAIVCYMQWANEHDETERTLESAIQIAAETPPQDLRFGFGHQEFNKMPIESRQRRNQDHRVDVPVAVYIEADGELEVAQQSFGWLDDETLTEVKTVGITNRSGFFKVESLGLVCMKETLGDTTYIAIADASTFEHWERTALTLAGIEVAILAIFFLISLAFSRWALKPVQETWDKQQTFIADASHELKTPISIISANTSIMLDEPESIPSERTRWLESTKKAADNMQMLVEDLLTLASIDDNDGSATGTDGSTREISSTSTTDLSRLIDAEVLQFESIAFERGLSVHEDISEGVEITADEESVRRIVNVLFDNAYKYVEDNGVVRISLAKAGSSAVFSISNTGSTIPQDEINSIFDRFYRVDDARTSGDGHGLGLSIAKASADSIGASIEVVSKNGSTAFTVRF